MLVISEAILAFVLRVIFTVLAKRHRLPPTFTGENESSTAVRKWPTDHVSGDYDGVEFLFWRIAEK